MRRETRLAIARLTFLITERDLSARFCACRRQIDGLVSAEIRKSLDEVEQALANEPEDSRWHYVETD